MKRVIELFSQAKLSSNGVKLCNKSFSTHSSPIAPTSPPATTSITAAIKTI